MNNDEFSFDKSIASGLSSFCKYFCNIVGMMKE